MEGENTETGNSEIRVVAEQPQEIFEDKTAMVATSDDVVEIRKEKVIGFLKKNYNYIAYVVLAIIVFLAVRIRTKNLAGLKDVTTGTWTLGPDLDPFLFLRYAKTIVAEGGLPIIDAMRYVPIGFNIERGFILHYYLIAWFHKLASVFGSESVTHSAVLFPAFMFGLTIIAFFFMTRKIFSHSLGEKSANVIGLIASFLLMVIPALLPRTIAGIPEKESAAFLFLFLAFYFFLSAWGESKRGKSYFFAILAGFSTAGMALIWGGFAFIFITIAPAVFIAFLLNKVGKRQIYAYILWIASSFILMNIFSARYTITRLFSSVTTGSAVIVLFVILVHAIIFNTNLRKPFRSGKLGKIPPRFNSAIVSVLILLVLSTFVWGVSFVPDLLSNLVDNLVQPATSRLIQTVAENRQPYFTEWARNFGPNYFEIPLTFWLFFIGSIYMFGQMVKTLKKNERRYLTLAYVIFLVSTIFSRYSASSRLNGENTLSLGFYALGFLIFVFTFGLYYYRRYKNGELDELKKIDFGFMFLLSFFFLGIVSARAAVRTIMVLAFPTSIVISYFAVDIFNKAKRIKGDSAKKAFVWFLAVLVIVPTFYAGYAYYNAVSAQASGYIPSPYTQQWQKAMFWVRENTQEDAVFGHWWDYGYWIQSIGERATVLDGGNGISYWNHLMGRYALTGSDNREALDFLYAHDTTHFLIDSTDIGKYSAYSLIGSDADLDRMSFIPTIVKDASQIQEKKDSTVFVYPASIALDGDITFEDNGTSIFLPRGSAGIAAVLVERDNENGRVIQTQGVYVYQGEQFVLPLRYTYDQKEFIDFGFGVESGVYIYPRAVQSSGGLQLDISGSMIYLSERTVKSQLARLYLYNEENPYFKLVHSEDDFVVEQIKAQNPGLDLDIIHFQGLRGPIKIWEINYPEDIEFKEEFVDRVYPESLRAA